MFWGTILLLLGMLMLLDKIGIIRGDIWDFFWPLALIALGVSMMLKHRNSTESND